MHLHLYQSKEHETTQSFKDAMERRGHKVTFVNLDIFDITNPTQLSLRGVDAVYYWGGIGTFGKKSLLHHVYSQGVSIINNALLDDMFVIDKIGQTYAVTRKGIRTPHTIIKTNATYNDVTRILGPSFIMKATIGSCGTKVFLIHDTHSFEEARQKLHGAEALYQSHIPNDGDYRVHVVGGRAVCVYKRVPTKDNFKANVAQGGTMEMIHDTKLYRALCVFAEKVCTAFRGCDIVGVDIMQHADTKELYFIEINATPGTKQVAEITGVDISDIMVNYVESLVRKAKMRKYVSIWNYLKKK